MALTDTDSDTDMTEVSPAAIGVRVLGRYEIREVLGKGAFGTVVACRDLQLGNAMVALKILSKSVSASRKGRARLAREIRAAHRIQHDHVVKFYDLIQEGDFLAIVMEYVPGLKLRDLINVKRLLPYTKLVETLRQTCEGLKAIHAHNIIHRDLKPDNILMSEDGIVKITDFGIASLSNSGEGTQIIKTPMPALCFLNNSFEAAQEGCGSNSSASHSGNTSCSGSTAREGCTRSGTGSTRQVLGTAQYVAPESIAHGIYNERSDIYAIGAITFELITGRQAFQCETQDELLRQKIERDPPAPLKLRGDCPLALNEFCMKAMCREPSSRYPSAEACLSVLRHAVQNKNLPSLCGNNMPLIESGSRDVTANSDLKSGSSPWNVFAAIFERILGGK